MIIPSKLINPLPFDYPFVFEIWWCVIEYNMNISKIRKVGPALLNEESNSQIPSAASLRNHLFLTAIKQSSNNKYDKPVTKPSRWSDKVR